LTRIGATGRCGSSEPGIATRASTNSRINAVRIEVSCRPSATGRTERHQIITPNADAHCRTMPISWSHRPVISSTPTSDHHAPAQQLQVPLVASSPSWWCPLNRVEGQPRDEERDAQAQRVRQREHRAAQQRCPR
jgi:hypothetical protein